MIGVFDSGYGGLSVLRHLRRELPERDFVYLGDSARAPYGGREAATILDFAEQATERLFAEGCHLVVVACNTVSCVALRHLQHRYAGPGSTRRVLGVAIPGAEAAVAAGPGKIGVLATTRTVQSGTYATEIHKLDPGREVVQLPAPLLAPLVEEGWEDTELAPLAVRRYLAALGPVDVLLLGCTHYPLLAPVFAAEVRDGTRVVDPAPRLALRLRDWLRRHPGFDEVGTGSLAVVSTGDPAAFARHGARFLGEPLPPVVHVAEVQGKLEPRDPAQAPRGQVVRPA